MKRSRVLWICAGTATVAIAGFGAWILSLPPATVAQGAPPIPQDESASILAALKPPKRERPLIAVVGLNDRTETTDYLTTYGMLRRAGIADVMLLAAEPGPVILFPALAVEPQATLAKFDAQYPDGADYVIVPAMSRDDDPAILHWLKSQSAKEAIVIGVCVGAKVVAAAGLLDGRRATTHWYYLDELRRKHPAVHYVADRRIVVDRGVATTTGITASLPLSLTLIEAIAGRERAASVARSVGVTRWDVRHESAAFQFNRRFALTVLGNRAAFWKHEELGLELTPGVDEVSLALVADAWSRTYRSRAVTFAPTAAPQETLHGVRVLPDRVAAGWPAKHRLPPIAQEPPQLVLDRTLQEIAARHGPRTAAVVAMQLEYPARAPH